MNVFFKWPSLALATCGYETSEVVDAIMLDQTLTYESNEQQSFDVEDGPLFGKGFEAEEDLTFYWQNMGYTHKFINTCNKIMGEKYSIDIHEEVYTEDRYYKQCEKEGREPQSCRAITYMSRVNKITRKTPHYLLSCAQDFRKGERGFQQHIWQASLGPEAIVCTNHPGTLGERDNRPDLWAGNAIMPRAVQHGDSLICIYDIWDPNVHQFTHAYFPKNKFDEVIEIDGWIIGSKNGGYVAIYSQNGYHWSQRSGYEDLEAICASTQNIWICQMGSKEDYGEFKAFAARVVKAEIKFDKLNVRYELRENHVLEFGWEGAPRFNGAEILIRGYGRFDNPFCKSEYLSGKYVIEKDNKTLKINS